MRHPYAEFEEDPLWQVVSSAVVDLAKNGDVSELTAHQYIVGYIVKSIRDADSTFVSPRGKVLTR